MATPRRIRVPYVHLHGEGNVALCGRVDWSGETLWGDASEVTCWRCLEQLTAFLECQCGQCVAVRAGNDQAIADVALALEAGFRSWTNSTEVES